MKWWEKTVEYYFVLKYLDIKTFIAPLDGKHEQIGDAILSQNNKSWILIEFKKDKSCLESEKAKFKDYEEAKKELKPIDGHHYLVYGDYNNKFDLKSQTYFGGIESEIENIFCTGVSFEDFSSYINDFIKFRVSPSDTGGAGASDYALVAGVNDNGEVVECVSFWEFTKQLDLTKEKKLENIRSFCR